ncbi:Uncharacterised protein [Mycobacteroides abscessus subsp. abscessus]|nr:Uncharacterised protein [Mycobacteroides abscessus subsp. abscessus]
MVRVAAVESAHMQRDPGVECQRLEHMRVDHGVVGHRRTSNRGVQQMVRLTGVHTIGTTGHIYHGMRQSLVHRDEGITEPPDALLVPESLGQRLPQGDGGVFDRVMGFDFGVALGGYREIKAGVRAQRGEHVVVERHSGVDLYPAGPVQVQFHHDVRLTGGPRHARCPRLSWNRHDASTSRSVAARLSLTFKNTSFSLASPTVTRR